MYICKFLGSDTGVAEDENILLACDAVWLHR